MAFADLKEPNPEESDADRRDTGNGATEEVEDEKGHDNIVDWEDFGGLDKYPVNWLEDIDAR